MVNRKDFRPSNAFGSGMSSKDRQLIQSTRKKVGNRDDVIKGFLNRNPMKTSNDSLSTDGKYLKSYNTVIATRQSDGSVLINQTKYSSTTSQQQSKLLRELKNSGTKYSVTGGYQRGYEGEDLEKPKTDNIEYLDFVESENANKKYVSVSRGLYDTHYEKFSDVVNEDGSSKYPIERNAKGYPVLYDRKGEDYRKQIKEEHKASKEYSELAEKNPQDKEKLKEISKEESAHAKELKKLESRKMSTEKYQSMSNEERKDYDRQQRDLQY